MVTDEERRVIAENLWDLSIGERVRYKEQFFELLDETVMEPDLGYHEMSSVFERLADLIDRPTCRMEYDSVHQNYTCSSCGEIYLDGVYLRAEETLDACAQMPFRYCPRCGAKVIPDE